MSATKKALVNDYSLTGKNVRLAEEKGLIGADWYTTSVPRDKMKEFLTRKDGPAIRDCIIWLSLLIASGYAGILLWGSAWAIIPFALYGILFASVSDSRWHESLHGTAFKSDFLNNALYEVASFMVCRESIPWRWSHMAHHSDTSIVGHDPELAVPRPPDITGLLLQLCNLKHAPTEYKKILLHCTGRLTEGEKTYIPETEWHKVFFRARIYLIIYGCFIGASIYLQSILPLMFCLLPTFYGAWLQRFFGLTQHAGMAEDVLDHRLNCRTIYMNPIFRFLYWEMNYHTEHHMFPMVPYHQLSKIHEVVKNDYPETYKNTWVAYKEIIPALLKQVKDPSYYVKRELPTPTHQPDTEETLKRIHYTGEPSQDGWIPVCRAEELAKEDSLRFDYKGKTYAVYSNAQGEYFATDGICTHGNTHLAEGMVSGNLIECPKHNGRFDIRDGSIQRPPVCLGLKTYPIREKNSRLSIDVRKAGGAGVTDEQKNTYSFKVVSNKNVATFIKELILEPLDADEFNFKAGEYLQLDIPKYSMCLSEINVDKDYLPAWKDQNLFVCRAGNKEPTRRNYSFASNPDNEKQIRFNVRLATPPPHLTCNAGTGSSYVFSLKPGDTVSAIGPFGDFHLKENEREKVFLGGGAGMAPLRSQISYLLETKASKTKASYWYGARSLKESYYTEYFQKLEKAYSNFSFHLALSEPQDSDKWNSHTGFIHEVLLKEYLQPHPDINMIDFYLCGPPPMMAASRKMLKEIGVSEEQVTFDEFD